MTRIPESKRSEFATWAREFEEGYLLEPADQRHIGAYAAERDPVTKHWDKAKAAKEVGASSCATRSGGSGSETGACYTAPLRFAPGALRGEIMRAHGYGRLCARYRNQYTFLRTIEFESHAAIEPLKMLLRDTLILPDDNIQIVGWHGFRPFSIRGAFRANARSRDALEQMGEESSPSPSPLPAGEGWGEGESRKGVPCPKPKATSSPLASCRGHATFVIR